MVTEETWLPRAEHVWVTDISAWGDQGAPGLLLAWRPAHDRRGGRRWEGWCIAATTGAGAHGGGPYVRQSWVKAESIRRADHGGLAVTPVRVDPSSTPLGH